MRRFFSAPFFLLGGALAGVASAYAAVQMLGLEAISSGSPWQVRNVAATAAVHPYTVAHYLLRGRLPPSGGQFVEFTASGDEAGNALTAACDYVLTLPGDKQPGWWSITSEGDAEVENATAMSSAIVAEADGSVRLTASPYPQPGNWIATPRSGRYSLLYTASRAEAGSAGAVPAFTIAKGRC